MSDFGRLVEELGTPWFVAVGGEGWRGNLELGLASLAIVAAALALVLVVAVVVRGER